MIIDKNGSPLPLETYLGKDPSNDEDKETRFLNLFP